jgi:hypothetical protein
MIDWITSLSAEELSAYAVTMAAAIALLSLASQARNQRRQTRLALLERRLVVFEAYSELLNSSQFAISCVALQKPELVEANDLLTVIERARSLADTAAMLFDSEIERLGDELIELGSIGHDVLLYAQRGLPASKKAMELVKRSRPLESEIRETFAPYVARERRAGLGVWSRFMRWWHRLSEENERALKGTPFEPPQPPINRHRPLD